MSLTLLGCDGPDAASDAAPGATASAKAPATLTEEKIRASRALQESSPQIADVTADIGAPFAQGKAPRRSWRFEKKQQGATSFNCETIDVIQGPTGGAVFDTGLSTSHECNQVETTKAQVQGILATLSGVPTGDFYAVMGAVKKPFDQAAGLFEKELGKPAETGEPDFAAWRYTGDGGRCRAVLVTARLASKGGQAIWGLSCD
ncbi:MAG: hypothetical protein WKG00_08420 [Polyangiaceae bacterium]